MRPFIDCGSATRVSCAALLLAPSRIDNAVPDRFGLGENIGRNAWRDVCSGDLASPFGSLTPADVPPFVSCLLSP